MLKKLFSLVIVFALCSSIFAIPVNYGGITVQVESLIGTGSNQTMIVVDWESGLTQSHAWLYQYNGTATVADAFDALAAACDFAWSQSAFVQYINYNDGLESHATANLGWLSFWNKDSGGDWAMNNDGVYVQQLVNGSWSGAVADDFPNWGNAGPAIPTLPEPMTIVLFAIGAFITRRNK
ncbi:MAG: hypothetical protein LLF92_02655 [Planctomycetaceae bacterium]|nr:hypothetical protein [Planctomycetaceae bacterium]